MLLLPTFRAALTPCSVSPAAFTPHPAGHFCSQCQRVVQDFSQSTDPVADLAAARAASPDGRVCGRFRKAQVQRPKLPQRLRWFLMALVLVVGQGLTAREALAQVRRPVPPRPTTPHNKHATGAKKPSQKSRLKGQLPSEAIHEREMEISGDILPFSETNPPVPTGNEVYTFVEQMPELPGGGGIKAIVDHIQQRVRYPQALKADVEGRVYASFIVGKDGVVREARIVKGLDPLLDAEALRVVQVLPAFTPGRHQGEAVAVSFTVPITFKIE
ncbi:energy transducer TonB [Hymenobacter sp. M29]|uniref:Energy transducer TonB n=1 Tax=Hymenobacter mellowenesis TaxID=3063995 RepID=A0ABT9A6Z1_9BACT|nr:energy transducer TonB [Hymenobacter sp. M29]MDO7845119.1 energy transducer TonB [Hymenobacter sp. M29]